MNYKCSVCVQPIPTLTDFVLGHGYCDQCANMDLERLYQRLTVVRYICRCTSPRFVLVQFKIGADPAQGKMVIDATFDECLVTWSKFLLKIQDRRIVPYGYFNK